MFTLDTGKLGWRAKCKKQSTRTSFSSWVPALNHFGLYNLVLSLANVEDLERPMHRHYYCMKAPCNSIYFPVYRNIYPFFTDEKCNKLMTRLKSSWIEPKLLPTNLPLRVKGTEQTQVSKFLLPPFVSNFFAHSFPNASFHPQGPVIPQRTKKKQSSRQFLRLLRPSHLN